LLLATIIVIGPLSRRRPIAEPMLDVVSPIRFNPGGLP
jgi:hypothetical protein